MRRQRALFVGAGLAVILAAGAVGAGALMDLPQDAVPTSPDPIGDILKNTPQTPPPQAVQPQATSPAVRPPVETAPAAEPAPSRPVVATPVDPVVVAQVEEKAAAVADDAQAEEKAAPAPDGPPARRQRRPVAVIQAIDKITAETMQFEVQVGGRPVRFNKALIFSVRACEVSAPDEQTEDAIAYVDVALQPRGAAAGTEPRQIFRGWMFASSPSVNGLQHPIYDAWVVGCKG
ncbi:MAG: DUF2155 domain-containing protein [Brevundimonas sp.]|uniref:DUF2155 domain-containing protein n=1 Tax=Brevundimonas sp. TaxID=1871086 RepID=UPI0025B96502|nr:DUF2155 domain-containing protein [Brevundimonas sp.]MBX3476470.1 DUF2155 domain-containing protein [Brevundimonas sp.]